MLARKPYIESCLPSLDFGVHSCDPQYARLSAVRLFSASAVTVVHILCQSSQIILYDNSPIELSVCAILYQCEVLSARKPINSGPTLKQNYLPRNLGLKSYLSFVRE